MKHEKCLFSRAFPGRGYSYLFSMPNEEEQPSTPTDEETRFSHILNLWLTSLTPGRALDQLCQRIQTSKKIFCQRKTLRKWQSVNNNACTKKKKPKNSSQTFKSNTFISRTVHILKVPRVNLELWDSLCRPASLPKGINQRYCLSSQSCQQTCGRKEI